MKPILFNTEMVRAILDGRKTVTRRIVKPQPDKRMPEDHNVCRQPGVWDGKQFRDLWYMDTIEQNPFRQNRWFESFAPYDKDEILYVRETWREHSESGGFIYKADYVGESSETALKWKPSIHMPKEAARIFLRVTDIRVEQLRDIECISTEGVTVIPADDRRDPRYYFAKLWESTIKQADIPIYGWYANPWVWVIRFERCEKPETKQ